MDKFKELSLEELEVTNGGIVPFIVVGVCLLLSSCNSQTNNNNAGSKSINVNGAGIVATDSATVNHNEVSAKVVLKP